MQSKKINPQKKGDLLEKVNVEFLKQLTLDLGFKLITVERMGAGTQFGRDIHWKFYANLDGKSTEFFWLIEDKHFDNRVLKTKDISDKLVQLQSHTRQTPVHVWCVVSPKVTKSTEVAKILEEEGIYRFKLTAWTRSEDIKELFECYPSIFKDLYGLKSPPMSDKRRKEIIKKWRHHILETSRRGKEIKDQVSFPTMSRDISDIRKAVVGYPRPLEEQKDSLLAPGFSERSSVVITASLKNLAEDKLDSANELLDKGKFENALEILFPLLGRIESQTNILTKEHVRTLNNIGVAYIQKGEDKKALNFFKQALEKDPGFLVANTNIASTYVLMASITEDATEKKAYSKKAKQIIDSLWKDAEIKIDENVMISAIKYQSLSHEKSFSSYLETELNSAQKEVLQKSNKLNYLLGSIYLGFWELKEADKYISRAIELKEDVESLILRSRLYMLRALKFDTVPLERNYEDLSPSFSKFDNLESALVSLDSAYDGALDENNIEQADYIKELKALCSLWKGDIHRIPEDEIVLFSKGKTTYFDALNAFRDRQFDYSFELLKKSKEWTQLPPFEIFRISRVFFYNGAMEISRILQKSLENTILVDDFRYWIDRSLVEVLLGNKNNAMQYSTHAKGLASDKKSKKVTLSHRGAVFLRYADNEGGDRLLKNSLEYEKEFPDDNILERFDFEKESERIITIIKERRKWTEGIRDKYVSNFIPSYFLEKVFNQPYIQLWSNRDPEFPLIYTINTPEFLEELAVNYKTGDTFIFDYLSLLTLSKLNLLYYIDDIFENKIIPFSTFRKIQEELLQYENETLRNLWDFLRKSTSITIEKVIPDDVEFKKGLNEVLSEELLDCFILAKGNKAVLVTDDFRLYRLSKSESIIPLNTWFLLQKLHKASVIDKVMYSQALGQLAEVFYQFIGFDSEDLFTITSEDKFKLTPRTYYLINQVFNPGSIYTSFTKTFVMFIGKLWSAGVLTEDKIYWLGYLTSINTAIFDALVASKATNAELTQISLETAYMWNLAISNAREEDINMLMNKLDSIIDGKILGNIKDTILMKIEERKEQFN